MFSGAEDMFVTLISIGVPGCPDVGFMDIVGICNPNSLESNSDWAKTSKKFEAGTNKRIIKITTDFLNKLNFFEWLYVFKLP